MTVGTLLRRARLDNHYDSIIIGSGMGGLTTAVCLAKAGQKVLILEKHYTAGGFTHTYERKGYEWDVGVHYIGDVHREGSTLRRVFDYIGEGGIHWAEMGPVYDRIHIGTEAFDYVKGEDAFRERMIAYFPDEKAAIMDYIKLIKYVNRSSSSYYMEHALPPWLARILYKKLTSPFLDYAKKTTEEVLLRLTKNRKLIAVLTGQWGDYGLPPSQSSFAMHALVAKHYLNGAAYPVGGSASIARAAETVLKAHGGQLITSAAVEEIMSEGRKATGVRLQDGRVIGARNIISAAGVINTFQKLLSDSCPVKKEYLQNLQRVTPSFAHMCLYIGVKGDLKELKVPSTNLWIYPNEDYDANLQKFTPKPTFDFPVVYISFPSSKDPDWNHKRPGKSTIEIVVPAPYAWFAKWKDTPWQKRGPEYNQLKKDMTSHLLGILLAKYPQLEGTIHYTELSSPLSTAHFSNYEHGEIYGINHDPQRFQERWLRTDTPVRNLYLTGQDIVTCGIGGALSAGVLTAIRVLGPFRARHLIALLRPGKRAASAVS